MPGVSEKAVPTHCCFCPSCSNKIMDRNLPFKIFILFAKWNLTIKTDNRIVFDQCRFIFQSEWFMYLFFCLVNFLWFVSHWDSVSCILTWPQTHCVAKKDFGIRVLLPLPRAGIAVCSTLPGFLDLCSINLWGRKAALGISASGAALCIHLCTVSFICWFSHGPTTQMLAWSLLDASQPGWLTVAQTPGLLEPTFQRQKLLPSSFLFLVWPSAYSLNIPLLHLMPLHNISCINIPGSANY